MNVDDLPEDFGAPYPGKWDPSGAVAWLEETRDTLGPGCRIDGSDSAESLRWFQVFWALAAVEAAFRIKNPTAASDYLKRGGEIQAEFMEYAKAKKEQA